MHDHVYEVVAQPLQFAQLRQLLLQFLSLAAQFQVRPHARRHFIAVERFGEVVHAATAEGLHLVERFRQGADKDYGGVAQAGIGL